MLFDDIIDNDGLFYKLPIEMWFIVWKNMCTRILDDYLKVRVYTEVDYITYNNSVFEYHLYVRGKLQIMHTFIDSTFMGSRYQIVDQVIDKTERWNYLNGKAFKDKRVNYDKIVHTETWNGAVDVYDLKMSVYMKVSPGTEFLPMAETLYEYFYSSGRKLRTYTGVNRDLQLYGSVFL